MLYIKKLFKKITLAISFFIWDSLFFHLLELVFLYMQILCFVYSHIPCSTETKENFTCLKTTSAGGNEACQFRLSTQLWHCFLLCVCYVIQVYSPSQSMHTTFLCAIGTSCYHFPSAGKIMWSYSAGFLFPLISVSCVTRLTWLYSMLWKKCVWSSRGVCSLI